MREIKFRAWDRENEVIILPDDGQSIFKFENGAVSVKYEEIVWREGGGETYEDYVIVDVDAIVMQYTGLKDKKGNEIYEGDIVEWNVSVVFDLNKFGVIKYRDAAFCIGEDLELLHILYPYCKIIGNIHENQDLLK